MKLLKLSHLLIGHSSFDNISLREITQDVRILDGICTTHPERVPMRQHNRKSHLLVILTAFAGLSTPYIVAGMDHATQAPEPGNPLFAPLYALHDSALSPRDIAHAFDESFEFICTYVTRNTLVASHNALRDQAFIDELKTCVTQLKEKENSLCIKLTWQCPTTHAYAPTVGTHELYALHIFKALDDGRDQLLKQLQLLTTQLDDIITLNQTPEYFRNPERLKRVIDKRANSFCSAL